MFKLAIPTHVRMKASFFGEPGSGKTFTALLFAEMLAKHRKGRIAFVDTEHGTKAYAMTVKERSVHPSSFDFDVLHTRSLAETQKALDGLDPEMHKVVILDSISHLWDAAREAWQAKHPKEDDIPLRAWGAIKAPYKRMMTWVVNSPFDVFVLGRERTVFDEDASGKLRNAGVAMRAEKETQYEPDFCFRMLLEGKRGGDQTNVMVCLKDRFGVLSGRRFPKPDGATIEPLLAYLGTDAIEHEDEEERLAADAELLDQREQKAEKKREKSTGLLKEFEGKIRACATVAECATVAADLKKQKRYMLEDHVGALRVIFTTVQAEIVAKTGGEV